MFFRYDNMIQARVPVSALVGELTLTRLKKRRGRRKKANWLLYGLAAFLLLLGSVWVYMSFFQSSNSAHQTGEGEVAIIDQLSATHPNTTFWHTVQSIFNEEELKTHYYGSVTVGFYRGLPSRGFSLIILRHIPRYGLTLGILFS